MKNIINGALVLMFCALLSACAANTQNQFTEAEVGRQVEVEFGQIVAIRKVKIQHKDSGVGAGAGMLAGAGAGSAIGNGDGNGIAILGGMVIGGIAGAVAEHKLQNLQGIAYTITKRNGKTVVITQNIGKDDEPLSKGQRVMIETSGLYQRVLPAEDLPEKVKKPKDIKVED